MKDKVQKILDSHSHLNHDGIKEALFFVCDEIEKLRKELGKQENKKAKTDTKPKGKNNE